MSLTSQALDLMHRRPGRRRIADRRPGAERDHRAVEPAHIVKATVIAQRARMVGDDDADNPRASYCLGRLFLAGRNSPDDPLSIRPAQFAAGERYAGIALRHASIMGYQTGSPRAATFDLAAGGSSCRQDPDEAMILDVRRQWSDVYRTLMDAGRELRRGPYVGIATYDICLDRISYEALDEGRVGDLRTGLNALCRMWRG